MSRRLSNHHYHWPKSKFPDPYHRSIHIWLKYEVHRLYHIYFLKNCRIVSKRKCWNEFCQYCCVCCYHQSHDTF